MPLASERFGEPGRFDFFRASTCFDRPDGVLVALVEGPEFFSESLAFSFPLFSSSTFCCSSLSRSVSVSSEL